MVIALNMSMEWNRDTFMLIFRVQEMDHLHETIGLALLAFINIFTMVQIKEGISRAPNGLHESIMSVPHYISADGPECPY